MSANLSGLGLELERAIGELPDTTAGGALAASVAGQLGRGIADLAASGFAKDEFIVQRDLAALEVSRTCRELAVGAPPTRGRAVNIAGAMADTTSIMSRSLSGYERWAVASALCDHLEPAVAVVERVSTWGSGASILAALANERVTALQQLTTAHPAQRADNAVLELPIVSPLVAIQTRAAAGGLGGIVTEGLDRLSAAATIENGLWSVEETLAVALACEQVSGVLGRDAERTPMQFWPAHVTTADSWSLVTRQLSKLEQPDSPVDRSPRVSIASMAYAVASRAPECRVAELSDAAQRLPLLASFASLSVAGWVRQSPVFTIEQHGDRSALVRLDAAALRPLRRALDDARGLAVAQADKAGLDNPVTLKRTWLHHHEAANSRHATDARSEAQARVHAALTRPLPPARGRGR